MCEETQNIKMERKMLREHEKTRRVFIRSHGDEEHTGLVERVVAECGKKIRVRMVVQL